MIKKRETKTGGIEFYDIDGNKIAINEKGVITLHINGKTKHIGTLANDNASKRSYYKEDSETEIFRKNNSWSINYEIFKLVEGTINIRTKKAIYRIEKEIAEKYGSFLWFKDTGVEKKIYIPLIHWKIQQI